MASASQIASAGTYITPDVGVEVTDGSNVRAQLGKLAAGSYGLKVISAGGSTTIIDGTSDVFKIAASGTLSETAASHTDPAVSVALTGLGTFSSTPGHLSFASDTSSTSSQRQIGASFYLEYPSPMYIAGSSGGSPTSTVAAALSAWDESYTVLSSGTCYVYLLAHNADSVSHTAFLKYYVLVEAAM